MVKSDDFFTLAWQIGAAIESGIDEHEARRRIDTGEIIAPVAGAATGGIAAATATGLGGVGLAFGGGAIGIGAATAVAAPAIAVGAVGYGVYRGIRELKRRNRDQTLRALVEYFSEAEQPQLVERLFTIEGKGRLSNGRRPPTHTSAKALLHLLEKTESKAFIGLFCSPIGEFVLTYDLAPLRWAYVRLISEDEFKGTGVDLRGQDFQVADLDSINLLIRVLEREEFLKRSGGVDEVDDEDGNED